MQERHCGQLVKRQLETINPNPGPTRRGKTERTSERKAERNERRKEKRQEKREKPSPTVTNKRIATWNLQGISLRENNRSRLKRTIGYIRKQKWEITLISEVRADGPGVIWLGKDDETTAVIHSQKTGIILRGSALNEWIEGNQPMEFKPRATYIQIGNLALIAVYQPVSTHGIEAIEEYRNDLEDLLARCPREKLLVIGGDHNSQIGRTETRSGLETATNEQGQDLLDWCNENSLEWVNGTSSHRDRGTWFHKGLGKWYELDGFIMRRSQRHKHARGIKTIREMTYSDHKPVILKLETKMKKWRQGERNAPNIKWEALRNPSKATEFRTKTAQMIENDEFGIPRS